VQYLYIEWQFVCLSSLAVMSIPHSRLRVWATWHTEQENLYGNENQDVVLRSEQD
jgi:hypothetical protein